MNWPRWATFLKEAWSSAFRKRERESDNYAGEPITPLRQVSAAISEDDVQKTESLLKEYPELWDYEDPTDPNWVCAGARDGSIEVVKWLLSRGMDINKMDPGENSCALLAALSEDDLPMVQLLLENGADPNLGRSLLRAVRTDDEDLGLSFAKLLVEHGVDVNKKFPWFGNEDAAMDAVELAEMRGKSKIAAYLRGLSGGNSAPASAEDSSSGQGTSGDPIVQHFAKQFGPVHPEAIHEIVPGGIPLALHVIKPTQTHQHLTIFTHGMSAQPMTVPQVEGFDANEYRFAELVIHLPPDWPLDQASLRKPEYGWPILWLRRIARYPHENQTWLGGPVTVLAEDDPPTPLWPGSKFVALLLFAKGEIKLPDDKLVQQYDVTPIYRSEYDLERREGAPALFRAFDAAGIETAFVPDRPSAV